MQISSIQNPHNYTQNFGIKISESALSVLNNEYICSKNYRKKFPKSLHFKKLIRKTESDKIEISKIWKTKEGKFITNLTYCIDGNKYSVTGTLSDVSQHNTDYTSIIKEFKNSLYNINKKLLYEVMESLADKGKLQQNLEIIKEDFPHSTKQIEENWDKLKDFEELSLEVIEQQKKAKTNRQEVFWGKSVFSKILDILGL